MAGNIRAADSWATRNGITALESALQGIRRCRQDVESTKNNLATGYQGSDGLAYLELIGKWERQCKVITDNLERMIDALNTNEQEVTKNQQQSNDAIRHASQKSDAAFSALMGG